MNANKLLKRAKLFNSLVKGAGIAQYYLEKKAGLIHDSALPAIRGSNAAARLSTTLNSILQEAVKEEPFPSGRVLASEMKMSGKNDGGGWTFNTDIVWKYDSLLKDPVVGAAVRKAVGDFISEVNGAAKATFDKVYPDPGAVAENVFYNNDASDFIDGGI